MNVRIVAFARIREIVGRANFELGAASGATAGDVWAALAREHPALAPLGTSTRLVRNGAFVSSDAALSEGDELALLPPYGGG